MPRDLSPPRENGRRRERSRSRSGERRDAHGSYRADDHWRDDRDRRDDGRREEHRPARRRSRSRSPPRAFRSDVGSSSAAVDRRAVPDERSRDFRAERGDDLRGAHAGGRDKAAVHAGTDLGVTAISAAKAAGGAASLLGDSVDDRFVDEEIDSSGDEAPTAAEAAAAADAGPLFAIPVGMSEEEAMANIMGFTDFNSTHGKPVADNHTGAAKGAVRRVLKREYRQYMNRRGGFNRPLDAQRLIKHG